MSLLQARITKVMLSGVLFFSGLLFLVPRGFANVVPSNDPLFGPITVRNPSFEIRPHGGLPHTCGADCFFSVGGIPNWQISGGGGQFQPSVSPHGGADFNEFAPNDGVTSAYSDSGTIFQTVHPKVQEGVTYILKVDIGRRNGFSFDGTADLLLSGPHPAEIFEAMGTEPSSGNWSTYTAMFTGNGSNVGDSITIQLHSTGRQGNFDSVELTAVPEPGTLVLFGSGLLLLCLIVHRKQLRAKAGNTDLIDVP